MEPVPGRGPGGEGLLLGFLAGACIAAAEVRMHGDLAHGTHWLALWRTTLALLLWGVAGLVVSVATAAWIRVRSAPWVKERALHLVAGILALAAVAWFAQRLLAHRQELLHAGRARLGTAVLVFVSVCALAVAALRVWRGRRRWPARAGWATLAVVLCCVPVLLLAREQRGRQRPSVILVSIDTWRADRFGSTTPLLQALARDGAVFEQAMSTASWTLPAHVSLLTSILPNDHRVLEVGSRVGPELLLLAECLRNQGYRTGAFTGGGYVSGDYGFEQGFDVYLSHGEKLDPVRGPEPITEAALRWVREGSGRPFFLFVHTYEPHGPYFRTERADPADRGRLTPEILTGRADAPLDPTESEKRYFAAHYDGGVARADRAIGGLLTTLRQDGILDGAVLAVTSDHGEDLWDHDAVDIPRHGHTLYEEIVHVPLMIRGPGVRPGTRVRTPVSHLDVTPTLLALAGLPVHPGMRGRSLADALQRGGEPAEVPIHAEAIRYGPARYAVRAGAAKIIFTPAPAPVDEASSVLPDVVEVYDLLRDPGERHKLPPPLPHLGPFVTTLRDRARLLEDGRRGGAPVEDERLLEELRSLGYVD